MPLVPSNVRNLVPYQPGRSAQDIRREFGVSRIVKLASNENPIGPSPKALERIASVLSEAHIYPNGGLALREKLAERFGVKLNNVMVGFGSEAILCNVIRTVICDDEEILTAEGTFIGVYVLANSRGAKLVKVPLKDYHYDLDAIAEAITGRTKLIYLANPNNPTGTSFTRKEFEAFMKRVPASTLVIMDEAYYEYACENPDYPDSLHYKFDNVVTLRTFSKAYGLAGIRIGYGFAHEELFDYVRRVKLPFEPSIVAEAAGLGALDDDEFLRLTVQINHDGKLFLGKALTDLGLKPVPTDANFFFVPFASEAEALRVNEELLKRGVIVRPLRAFGLPEGLRMTIGTREQNEVLIGALREIVK